ncbi:sialidase family protein [Spirilliplanes yamanashiensis]|nr:sialidase family protein [Spirilliplanes yamanashiensis]MDP9814116.1 hypothetical protein [Spirilliplanes yamanashiensis]
MIVDVPAAPRGTTARAALAWLGHPLVVLALALLLVNDHVLKAAHPSWWTGKLSDAAGLVLAPPLLALALRLPARAAVLTTGAGFVLLKSNAYGAALASGVWSLAVPSHVVADATDLLALPALALSWLAWRTATPAAGRATRAVRAAVLLPLALAGVAATSAVTIDSATAVGARDGVLVAYYRNVGDAADDGHTVTSTDHGATWTRGDDPVPDPAAMACSTTDRRVCYRVVRGAAAVDRSADAGATWRRDWALDPDVRRRHDEPPRSQSVAVLDVPGGGHVVLVANEADGLALRRADGTWERLGFPAGVGPEGPELPQPGAARPEPVMVTEHEVIKAGLLTLLLAFLAATLGAARQGHRAGRAAGWLSPAAVALLLALTAGLYLVPAHTALTYFLYFVALLVVLAALSGAITHVTVVSGRSTVHRRWALRVWLGALLAAALPAAAFAVLVARGPLVPWWGVLVAVVAAAPGAAVALRAAR